MAHVGSGLILMCLPAALAAAVPVAMVVSARAMACGNWSARIPTDCIHYGATPANPNGGPWFGSLNGGTGTCAALPGVTAAIGLLEEAPSPLATWPGAGTTVGFAVLNWSTSSFVGLGLGPGGPNTIAVLQADAGSVSLLGPAWLRWASPARLLSWRRVVAHGGDSGLVVTETLTAIDGLPDKPGRSTELLSHVTRIPNGTPVPPPILGHEAALDVATGVLYTARSSGDGDGSGGALGRFDVNTGESLPPVPTSPPTAALACLHYDAGANRLGALAISADNSAARLVSIDPATGAVNVRAVLPSWAPWTPIRKGHAAQTDPVVCSHSADAGAIALLLGEIDSAALPSFALKNVAVVTVSTAADAVPTGPAPVNFPWGAGAGRSWRVLEPAVEFV